MRLFYDAHAHCMCECCLEGIGYRAYGKRGEFYFYRSVATLVLKRDFLNENYEGEILIKTI